MPIPSSSSSTSINALLLPLLVAALIAAIAAILHSTQVISNATNLVRYTEKDSAPKRQQLRYIATKAANSFFFRNPTFSTTNYLRDGNVVVDDDDDDFNDDDKISSASSAMLQTTNRQNHVDYTRKRLHRVYQRNEFTFDHFPVAGVDLAQFGLDSEPSSSEQQTTDHEEPPYKLFHDFDLSSKIIGNETWLELLNYRRDATHPTLSFYVDKIARKRWLPTVGMDGPKPYLLVYAKELAQSREKETLTLKQLQRVIIKRLPIKSDCAAKPSHLSCSGGVWLFKNVGDKTYIGHGKTKFEEADEDFSIDVVAADLAEQLQKIQYKCGRRVNESLALVNAHPGILAEERFTSPWEGEDDKGGIEFKLITIWGRVWLGSWRPGISATNAYLLRNGSNYDAWFDTNEPLPAWVNWDRIVDIAERMGANKDMFRTDIFVGVPSIAFAPDSNPTREERMAAIRYVVSETEIHPTEYHHTHGAKPLHQEGARLWLAGYQIGNYDVVPNTEVPKEFIENGGMLPPNVTVSSFEVAGVDLAQYTSERNQEDRNALTSVKPFELFDNFDLSSQIIGNESWTDLLRYRRDETKPSLSFYVDKIARRRWLPSLGIVDLPKSIVLKYGAELTAKGGAPEEQVQEILNLLPVHKDYVAKPTHLSCSGGVWLTKMVGDTTYIGHGKKSMEEDQDFSPMSIAKDLSDNLNQVMRQCGSGPESWALQNVKPGIMVEQRFTSWESVDDRGAMEFKVHTIWGRVWLVYWRAGTDGVNGFYNRDGSPYAWEGKNEPLPTWLDWDRIITMAEHLGAHKDMFRSDIFVGVPAGATETRSDKRIESIRYVLSETEIHPTPIRGTERVFQEGGRLWLAGYKKGNYKVVPDTEVPPEFTTTGLLAEKV